jgi:protein-tyrosine kinase
MSAEPSTTETRPSAIPDEEVHKALVLLYRLSNEAVGQINELMKKLDIRFTEAAVHTGHITREELDKALQWIRLQAVQQTGGIVEKVLSRAAERREVVLWEGKKLVPSNELVLAHDPDHPESEKIRGLRTELLLQRRAGLIALLSPSAGEGRSRLAAELAIGFAQLGRPTLLVDADLRQPRQHMLFGTDNEHGLTQALTTNEPLQLHGVQGLPKMALLTSGTLPPNPLDLLSGTRFEYLAKQWRRNFEFVVLDTPPASEFSDGLATAKVAGQFLLLGRANETSFRALNEMLRRLEATNARTLGAVINRF